ncbi:3-dehydroquinate synthase [Aquisalimonas sp. 2447]|uniref:3-dehydroquinate synthase n=1 Tax=Aquisalimonas sp. 2447 TaxID=2740807 RepID=UPI0014326622|nr:3-dehydroquinate synthase [Aquisalimonas sp. 2447]QIT53917.1 3-dehydroquinate synthase [Aquisalimonas sp. 2447]
MSTSGTTTPAHRLTVALGDRSYPIVIGPGQLGNGDELTSWLPGRQALVVSNETVAPLYLDTLLRSLDGKHTQTLTLPDGEAHKTVASCEKVWDSLLEHRFERSCTVIALGGGVIGDLAGFAAAAYQRGVAFVQIPTTLLAQVDSSVGGKTGVNHPLGKNMIGAFHQPLGVIADTGVLATLPEREISAGLAEVIKYGLIRDAEFFAWLEANIGALLARDEQALAYAIERSCANKAAVVAADEREQGVRATLNLGHTFGHAIETATGYSSWLHGEAVGAGIAMAAHLARAMDWLSAEEQMRILDLLRRAKLPVAPPSGIPSQRFLELMAVDKKAQGGRIRLVLQRRIGHATVTDEVPDATLRATLDHFTGGL